MASLLASGAVLSMGSDWPVSSYRPLEGSPSRSPGRPRTAHPRRAGCRTSGCRSAPRCRRTPRACAYQAFEEDRWGSVDRRAPRRPGVAGPRPDRRPTRRAGRGSRSAAPGWPAAGRWAGVTGPVTGTACRRSISWSRSRSRDGIACRGARCSVRIAPAGRGPFGARQTRGSTERAPVHRRAPPDRRLAVRRFDVDRPLHRRDGRAGGAGRRRRRRRGGRRRPARRSRPGRARRRSSGRPRSPGLRPCSTSASDDLARTESRQTGKPIRLSTGFDVPGTVDNVAFFAGAARNPRGQGGGGVLRRPHVLRPPRGDRRRRLGRTRGTTRCRWRPGRSCRRSPPATPSCSSRPS